MRFYGFWFFPQLVSRHMKVHEPRTRAGLPCNSLVAPGQSSFLLCRALTSKPGRPQFYKHILFGDPPLWLAKFPNKLTASLFVWQGKDQARTAEVCDSTNAMFLCGPDKVLSPPREDEATVRLRLGMRKLPWTAQGTRFCFFEGQSLQCQYVGHGSNQVDRQGYGFRGRTIFSKWGTYESTRGRFILPISPAQSNPPAW